MSKKNRGKQNSRYQKVPKPLGLRLNELTQSLLILRDCLELVNEGKIYHFLPVYAQLRLLLTEKSKANKPLLLDLADIYRIPLTLGFAPLRESTVPGAVVTWISLQLATEPDGVRQFRPLEEFLDTPVLFYSGQPYTPRKLIESFANNEGGAHFSASRPAEFTGMVQMISQPVQINLYKIAEATYKLGVKLLRSLRDIELYYILYFPKQPITQDAYVFDMKYPSTTEYTSPLRIY